MILRKSAVATLMPGPTNWSGSITTQWPFKAVQKKWASFGFRSRRRAVIRHVNVARRTRQSTIYRLSPPVTWRPARSFNEPLHERRDGETVIGHDHT